MNFGRVLLFAFVLCYATLVFSFSLLMETAEFDYSQYQKDNSADVNFKQDLLKRQYQLKLEELLSEYSQQSEAISQESSLAKMENDLLDLPVPAEYKDLHFQLLQSLFKFQDQDVQGSRALVEQIISQYSWLSSKLSLFLINNF